jgi:hypothetical protein
VYPQGQYPQGQYPTMSPVGAPPQQANQNAYEGGSDGYYPQPHGYPQAHVPQRAPPRASQPIYEHAPPQNYQPPPPAPYEGYEGYPTHADDPEPADYGWRYRQEVPWHEGSAAEGHYHNEAYQLADDRRHNRAAAKETPAELSSSGSMDRAVDDIFSCARHNRVDDVERLLDLGVPVNVRDKFGNTILTISCQNGNKRVTKAALRRGADINAQNYKGNTPLHFCFTYGYGDTLGQYMISKGADPAIRNEAGLSCYDGLGH